ncbi:unnamed protein product [Cuscuta campestris]|uniref:Uncharacterized protein n=1 Tax=Cuscuta campestris TaxID=132261 RepID=A0A484NK40_9ASTE|nr:unnamed protein product [Cuscuta campestris]
MASEPNSCTVYTPPILIKIPRWQGTAKKGPWFSPNLGFHVKISVFIFWCIFRLVYRFSRAKNGILVDNLHHQHFCQYYSVYF